MFEHNGGLGKDIAASKGYFSDTSAGIYFNTMYRLRAAPSSKDPYARKDLA